MTPLYLDNDVIAKLASFDLLDDAIEALGSGKAFVRILSTFKYRFGIANERRRLQVERQVGRETYAQTCKALVQSLEHRVICLEQVLREVIGKRGFEYTKHKVVPAVDCDNATRAIFGMGLDAEEVNVTRALDSYINDLRRNSGRLLWKPKE